MATKEKKKLTQAEKEVIKAGHEVDKKSVDNQNLAEHETQSENIPWWKKVAEFFGRVFATIRFYITRPFIHENVIVDHDTIAENEVYAKGEKEVKKQTDIIKAREDEEKSQTETEEKVENTSEVIEISRTGDNTTVIEDDVEEVPDEPIDNVEEEIEDDGQDVVEPVVPDSVENVEFETSKCETFNELQISINSIDESVLLSSADDGKLILATMDNGVQKASVEFTMDELNAEGLSECIGVSLSIATNIANQLEENANLIKTYLNEKRVNIMIAELDQKTIESKTDLRLLAQQMCSNQDGVKNVTMDEMEKSLLFHMNVGGYDAEKGECTEDIIVLNIADATATRNREFTDWQTMRSSSESIEVSPENLPASVKAFYEFAQRNSVKSMFAPAVDIKHKEQQDEFPIGSEILDEDDGPRRHHKKNNNHRREQAQVKAFEDAMNSGKAPQTKAQKREERKAENAAKRRAEQRARDEDAR